MINREKFKVYKDVFDEKTLRVLFKLESDGYFEELASPISIGKEANIFSAVNKDGDYVIVKIYRINNTDFKKMYSYISADSRFAGLNNQRRKVIFAWAQREYRNLMIAREAGANVPTPYAVKDNVLVMELIGDKENAAPRLKDKSAKNSKLFYSNILKNIKFLYKAGIVHGDLSEFNILNFNEKPFIIDLSHGTKIDSALSEELLERDLNNLVRYFGKYKIKLDMNKMIGDIKNAV
jgi:RIO kinase 1